MIISRFVFTVRYSTKPVKNEKGLQYITYQVFVNETHIGDSASQAGIASMATMYIEDVMKGAIVHNYKSKYQLPARENHVQ